MRLKIWLGILAAVLLGFVALPANSQVATITLPFSVSSNGVTAPIAFSGQTSCALQFTATGTTATVTVYGSTPSIPGYTNPITSIGNSGTVTNPTITSYSGAVAGFIGAQISFTNVVGTYSGNLICGSSIVSGASTTVITNSTNSPVPVACVSGCATGSAGGSVIVANGTASPVPVVGIGTASIQIVPGSPIPVNPAVNPGGSPTPLNLDANGRLLTTTPAPYVAPTCPGAPQAPCVQVSGPVAITGAPTPYPTNADGGAPSHITNSVATTQANNPCSSGTLSNYAINISTAVTTQAVALSGSTKVYLCKVFIMGGGTTNVTLEYGTGTLCATGLTAITGPVPLAAQAGWVEGNGGFTVYPGTGAGTALCIVNSAAVQLSGSLEYVQQ